MWLPEESQTSDLVLSGKAPPSPPRLAPWLGAGAVETVTAATWQGCLLVLTVSQEDAGGLQGPELCHQRSG